MQEKFLKFARYPKCFGYVFTIIMLILSITTFIFLAPWNHRIDTSGWEKVNTPVNIRILNSEKSYSFFNRIEVGFFNRRHRTSPSSPTSSIVYKTTFHFESIPDVIKFSAEQETGAHDYQNPQSGNMEEIKGKQDGRITYTGICFSDSPILTGDIQVERSLVNKPLYQNLWVISGSGKSPSV